jgi:hypothetical protein
MIIIMMILMMMILQMIQQATSRDRRNLKKNALNQRKKKMKLRMISNQSPLTMKNLLPDILEEVVLTLLMKNPRKVVITAMNPTEDQRMILTIHLKNLNRKFQKSLQDLELVHQCLEDHQGFPSP